MHYSWLLPVSSSLVVPLCCCASKGIQRKRLGLCFPYFSPALDALSLFCLQAFATRFLISPSLFYLSLFALDLRHRLQGRHMQTPGSTYNTPKTYTRPGKHGTYLEYKSFRAADTQPPFFFVLSFRTITFNVAVSAYPSKEFGAIHHQPQLLQPNALLLDLSADNAPCLHLSIRSDCSTCSSNVFSPSVLFLFISRCGKHFLTKCLSKIYTLLYAIHALALQGHPSKK